MLKIRYFLILTIFYSCSLGHINEHGIPEPNNPNFRLKNKIKDSIPKELDTFNLYKYYGYYNNNALVEHTFRNPDWNSYEKFSSNGRAYGFGTDSLNEKNLNPIYASKGYYIYDKKRDVIKYEVYTSGNGGEYVISNYNLSEEGDTLTSVVGKRKSRVYIREKIPKEWKRYNPNW